MLTQKAENGGARLTLVNFDSMQKTLWLSAVPEERGSEPKRPTNAIFGNRSKHIDIAYGRQELPQ